MFDAQCDLAALVYEKDQDPDAILRDFAAELNSGGFRVVGMVQSGQCADASLSAVLVHTGEVLALAQDATSPASGCKLDLGRLQNAAARVADAMADGADLVIVNRFGKRERDGKGLSRVIERALDADIPVVIAVSSQSFPEWIKFADGMSVKLHCERASLEAWWQAVSARNVGAIRRDQQTVCEVFK
jgi:nucleoside-triphosphatase THEP1